MINNSDFSKRLKIVLEHYQLSASQFAEKIEVQRSSISHLLSGRNKPSLDFILKVLAAFDEIEFYWLINGKGSFPKKESLDDFPTTLFSNTPKPKEPSITRGVEQDKVNSIIKLGNEIDKIVVFYTNGTFKHYIKG